MRVEAGAVSSDDRWFQLEQGGDDFRKDVAMWDFVDV